MLLAHLSVENHAAIPNLDLEVRDHLVVIGPNETGKTSLLRLLDATFNANLGRLHAVLDESSFRDLDAPVVCTVTLTEPSPDEKAAFADELDVLDDGSYRLTVQVISNYDPVAEDVVVSRRTLKMGRDFNPISARKLSDVGFAFLPTTRSPDRELSRGQTSAMRSLLRAVDLGAERDEVEAQLARLHEMLDTTAPLEQLRTRLAEQLGKVAPTNIDTDDVTLRLSSSTTEDLLADVDVRLRSGEDERPLTSQSDGFRALATVAIQLLADDGTAIVAVDEPETHLHPTAQRRIGRLLRDGDHQAVVSTHSSSVLSMFDPMEVVAFTASGDARQLATPLFAGGKRKDHPQWWVADRLEPLTARAVLLVEGVADRLIVEAAAAALDWDLDRRGISVVDVTGNQNFTKALKLFGPDGFDIPFALLVDEREAAGVADDLGIDMGDLEEHGVLICRDDLESQYIADLGPDRVRECLIESGEWRPGAMPDLDAVEDPALAMGDHCGGRSKVKAAMGLASAMTAEDAQTLEPIVAVLQYAIDL